MSSKVGTNQYAFQYRQINESKLITFLPLLV